MKTQNSVDLKQTRQTCHAYTLSGDCASMTSYHRECGSYRCPFYKPQGCKDWIRVEDEDGINLIPPEEYRCARMKVKKKRDHASWKITPVRCAESR